MLPKDSLSWIADVEFQLDAPHFAFAGLHAWPIVRNTLLSAVLPVNKSSWPQKQRQSRTSRFLISSWNLLTLHRSHVFFLTDPKYVNLTDGCAYLKDVDAVSDPDGDGAKDLLAGLQDVPERGKKLSHTNTVSVFAITSVAALVSRAHPLMRLHPGWRSFSADMLAALSKSGGCPAELIGEKVFKSVRKNVLFSVIASYLFSILLLRVKPKRCYIHCYYSLLGMALTAACRRSSISIADVQHGISGRNMRAYANWSVCPLGGYNTMPDVFLCWTSHDQKAISDWAIKVESGPVAKVTGQMWLKHIKSSGAYDRAVAEWVWFFDVLSSDATRIVVTLQAPELDIKIRKLIQQNRQSIFFIRAHPDIPFENLPVELSGLESEFDNVYVDAPSRMPIHVLMANSDLHITEWSASVYDAWFSGIKSIVISPSGRDYFEDFISDDKVYYAQNSRSLAEYVAGATRRTVVQGST